MINKRDLVSIIIPVYNAEKYIARCIYSVIHQTCQKLEILVINDGSADASVEILNQCRDNRLRLIHQKNQGAAAARRRGLEQASGEWIFFVDADDYLEPDVIASMLSCANTQTDLVVCNSIKENQGKREFVAAYPAHMQNGEIQRLHTFFEGKYQWGLLWGKLIRRSVIEKYHCAFDINLKVAEDVDFMMQVVKHCRSVEYWEGYGYHYCMNKSSLSRSYQEELKESYIRACQKFETEVAKLKDPDVTREFYSWVLLILSMIAINYCFHPANNIPYRERAVLMRTITGMEPFQKALAVSDPIELGRGRGLLLKTLNRGYYWPVALLSRIRYRQL